MCTDWPLCSAHRQQQKADSCFRFHRGWHDGQIAAAAPSIFSKPTVQQKQNLHFQLFHSDCIADADCQAVPATVSIGIAYNL